MYEFVIGLPPFYDEDRTQMFKNILTKDLEFPKGTNPDLKKLLSALLNKNSELRIHCC